MAEAGLTVLAKVGFQLLPVVLVVADALAIGADGQQSLQLPDACSWVTRRSARLGLPNEQSGPPHQLHWRTGLRDRPTRSPPSCALPGPPLNLASVENNASLSDCEQHGRPQGTPGGSVALS